MNKFFTDLAGHTGSTSVTVDWSEYRPEDRRFAVTLCVMNDWNNWSFHEGQGATVDEAMSKALARGDFL